MQQHFSRLTTLAAAFWLAAAAWAWPAAAVAGMLAVQGVALWLIRRQPTRHWPVIGTAAAQILLMPLVLPWPGAVLALFWWIAFGAILAEAYQQDREVESIVRLSTVGLLREGFAGHRTQHGQQLNALVDSTPAVLFFLRHAGCTFCRQTLADVAEAAGAFQERGVALVLVHHGSEEGMQPLLERYGVAGLAVIHDPQRRLYRHFGLETGTWWQVANPWVMWKSAISVVWQRHGMRRPDGDARQLGGAFAVAGHEVRAAFYQRQSSDRARFGRLLDSVT